MCKNFQSLSIRVIKNRAGREKNPHNTCHTSLAAFQIHTRVLVLTFEHTNGATVAQLVSCSSRLFARKEDPVQHSLQSFAI